uniref:Uncharacterized protein n=1 Tax=Oryzias melastigma TaxID=30732 RepID=A0A3B3CCW2_ORYME
ARPFALSIQEKRKKYIYIKRKKEKRTRRRDPSEPRRLHAERAPLGSHALGCSFTQRSVRAENWEITSLYGCASSAKTISRPGLSAYSTEPDPNSAPASCERTNQTTNIAKVIQSTEVYIHPKMCPAWDK